MAGIQIAISQPIRLDDVVIVEGTYGRVQEITLTDVVINTWDERNLIVPIKSFLENSFENWTYTEARILGKRVPVYRLLRPGRRGPCRTEKDPWRERFLGRTSLELTSYRFDQSGA